MLSLNSNHFRLSIPGRGVQLKLPDRNLHRIRVHATVQPPPSDYDFRQDCQHLTASIISARYPQLQDLVDDGSLVALPRPSIYVERRTDGYEEPELVLLLGTAHVSDKSASDTRRLIEATKPQNVVVELCRSRAGIMYESEESGTDSPSKGLLQAGGGSFSEVMSRVLLLGGGPALVLRLLLARATTGFTAQLDIKPGVEFRAARIAAEAVGSTLVLGDRPIEVSLRRAWDTLSLRRRATLLFGLARAAVAPPTIDGSLSPELVESLKTDSSVSAMLREFTTVYPEVALPLLHERDVYIAWSLTRSKAVNGCQTVVGIIGRGHLPGVVHAMTHSHGKLRFRDLAGRAPSRDYRKGFAAAASRRLVFEIALLAGTVAVWQWWVSLV